MTLVAFVRGANVGGHRRFRPSLLAKELSAFDVVNIGAAGTFVVRTPGSKAAFHAALAAKLPFEAHVMLCDAREIVRIVNEHPFTMRARPDVTRFVSVLPKLMGARIAMPIVLPKLMGARIAMPIVLPAKGRWLVRLIACDRQFVFGEYRRDMKTIGYLGQIDALVGAPVTTRSWSTIATVARTLSISP